MALTAFFRLNHPAMVVSLNELGSFIIDVEVTTLKARMLAPDQVVRDAFGLLLVVVAMGLFPRVALRTQPWAMGRNPVGPVGILRKCRTTRENQHRYRLAIKQ